METPSRSGGVHVRVSSPSGDSTLTTSAPMSASSIVAYGPASTREKSATSSPRQRAWHVAPPLSGQLSDLYQPSDGNALVRHGSQPREVRADLPRRGQQQRQVLADEPLDRRLGGVRVDVHRGDDPARAVA